MKNKKRGSTILMVLMISTIMIVISAAISSSLVFTTLGNTVEKYKNDYVYAAEGGLELGIQRYMESGAFTEFTIPYLESISENVERGIDKVEVTFEQDNIDNNKGKIISTVYKMKSDLEQEMLVQISVPVEENNSEIDTIGDSFDFLRYSLYSSGDIEVSDVGSANFNQSNIGYKEGDDYHCNIESSSLAKPDSIVKDTIAVPRIKEGVSNGTNGKLTVGSFQELWNHPDAVDLSFSVDGESDSSIGVLTKGIGKLAFESNEFLVKPGGWGYKLIIVDTPELHIDIKTPQEVNSGLIIICTGKITIDCQLNPGLGINILNSTLYANGIYISNTASLHATGSPNYTLGEGNNVSVEQANRLNVLLDKYFEGWGIVSSEPDGDSSSENNKKVNYDDIEYIIP